MIDFAHNPAGYDAVANFLDQIDANRKIGIIAGVGDRRDNDIRECGKIAARMFDHIIIRQERHLRGRTQKEIVALLLEGIFSINQKASYEIIPNEVDAIKHAFSIAQKNDFIVALSDVISNAIEIVESYLEQEKNNAFS